MFVGELAINNPAGAMAEQFSMACGPSFKRSTTPNGEFLYTANFCNFNRDVQVRFRGCLCVWSFARALLADGLFTSRGKYFLLPVTWAAAQRCAVCVCVLV
jgi:hypothetical protein